MFRCSFPLAVVVVVVFAMCPVDAAQAPTAPKPVTVATAAPAAKAAPTAVRVEIVLSRYAGEKRVSTQPYVLMMVANFELKTLRTGAEVPIATTVPGKEKENYKSIGTQIMCRVQATENGGFRGDLSVTSSSVYPDQQKQAGPPAFRTFSLAGEAYFIDGKTVEIASATDTVTGEVIKAEMTVSSVK